MAGVTMTAVARDAGVSVSTVSHVVNGTRPVNRETRRLVMESIERLGYRQRPVAGSLAAGSTETFGLAQGLTENPGLRELVDGVEEETRRRGAQLLIVDSHDDPAHEERVVAHLLAHHVTGMLITPSLGWEGAALRLLRERRVPFVVLDRPQSLPVDQVGVENEVSSAALVDHLLHRGHERVAFVGGPALSTVRERRAGYELAHHRRDLTVDPRLVVQGCRTQEEARRAVQVLLAAPHPPDALYTSSEALTVGALRALRTAGLRVPEDIAMVCFDEPPWSGVAEPSMTTVRQPSFAIGARAVQLLVRRLSTPEIPHQSLRLAGEIVHRRSCGCEIGTPQDVSGDPGALRQPGTEAQNRP